MTWPLAGKYPRILQDEVVGEEARRLFADANAMLNKLDEGGLLQPRGVVGLFPANREGDDIVIYRDENRRERLAVAHYLRQQTEKNDFANYCLADCVAPKASGTEKQTLWSLLEVTRHTGMQLTESFAMWPEASVAGWYFSHPDSKYFAVAQIQRDQVEDYAIRKGPALEEIERWLGPNLGYDAE